MKNFIFKHKIKILLILFFVLLLSLNKNIYASSSITEEKMSVINELMTQYPDCDTWVSITYRSQDAILLTSSNEDYNLYVSGTTIGACNNANVQWYCFWYYPSTNTYKLFYQGVVNKHGEMTISTVYSNKTIYADSKGEEIFFQIAPLKATTLQEIMEQVEKEAILKEIVVLLPVILSVLVSLIALRKALKMLLGSLRTS